MTWQRIGLAVLAAGLVGLVALSPRNEVVAQSNKDEPTDLAMVHPDAAAVARVQLRDLWKHESLKDMRKMFLKAGSKAFTELDSQFAPKPSTVDRITIVVPKLQFNSNEPPAMVVIVRFTEAFNPRHVLECMLPGAVTKKVANKEIYVDEGSLGCLHFADDTTLVYSDVKTLADYFSWAPKPAGPLKAALLAESSKLLVGVVNLQRIPELERVSDMLPAPLQPLARAQLFSFHAELGQEVSLNAKLSFPSADEAKAGEKALRMACDLARMELAKGKQFAERQVFDKPDGKERRNFDQLPEYLGSIVGLAMANTADEFLAEPPIKQNGASLAMKVELPAWSNQMLAPAMLGAGLALPAIQKVREAAARTTSMNNLKQIGIAVHSYHDVIGSTPPAAILDKKGKKLLSWRVMILPYIDQDNLYKQFKLDEPWDSDNNKKLIAQMPRTYADPRKLAAPGETYYKVFVGKDAGFTWEKGRTFAQFTDGLSNTAMVVTGGDPVIWTKPDDIEFDPEKELPDLKKPFNNLITLFFDGSVRMISFPPGKDRSKLLKLIIQINDGQPIPNDF